MRLKYIIFITTNKINEDSCLLLHNLELMEIHSLWNPSAEEVHSLPSDTTLVVSDTELGAQFAGSHKFPYILKWDETNSVSPTPKPVCYYDQIEALTCEYLTNQWKRAHHLPITITETRRLILKELSLEDYEKLYFIREKKSMISFLPVQDTLENELAKHKHYIMYQYEFFDYGLWGVYLKDGTLIGQAGIQNQEYRNQTILELSYLIGPEYQRKGYATEAILAIYDYVVSNLQQNRLLAIIAKNNLPSIKTAMNLGMKRCEEVEHLGFPCNYYIIDDIKDFVVRYHSEQKRAKAAKSAFRNAIKHPVQEVYSRYKK